MEHSALKSVSNRSGSSVYCRQSSFEKIIPFEVLQWIVSWTTFNIRSDVIHGPNPIPRLFLENSWKSLENRLRDVKSLSILGLVNRRWRRAVQQEQQHQQAEMHHLQLLRNTSKNYSYTSTPLTRLDFSKWPIPLLSTSNLFQLPTISTLAHLTTLSLARCVDKINLNTLTNIITYTAPRSLRNLDLSYCGKLVDDGLICIICFFSLHDPHPLQQDPQHPASHHPMQLKGRLKSLKLRACPRISDSSIHRISTSLSHSLITLDVSYCPRLTDRALWMLGNGFSRRSLRELSILELSFPDPPAIETRKRVLSDIEEDLRFESTRSRRGGRVQGHLTPQPVFHHQQNYSIFDFGAGGAGAGIPLKINSFLTTLHLGYGCKYLGIPILQSILSQCLLGERQDSGGSGGAGRLRDSKLISLDLYDISSFSRHNNEGQTFLHDLARMIVKAGNKLRYLGLRNFKAGLLDPSFIVILANGGEGKPVEKKEGVREEEDSNLIVEGTLSASNFSSLSSSSATSKDRNLHSSNNKTNTINSSHLQMLDLSLSDLGGHSPLLSTPTLLDALATNINSFPNLLALNLGWCKSVGKRELDHSAIGRLCSALADKHLSFSSAHDVPRPIDFKWLDIRGVEPFNHYGHFEMGTNDDVSTMETTIRCPVLTWMRNAFEDFPPLEELCRYFHDDIPLSGHKSIFTGRRLVKLLQMTSAGDGLL